MKIPTRFKHVLLLATLLATATMCICQNTNRKIIDVHFHALRWNSFGTPPPPNEITGVEPAARSDSEEQAIMLAALKKNGVVKAVLSGVPDLVNKYTEADDERLIRGFLVENEKELPDTATFVQLIKDGKLNVFGELGLQYFGKVLTDPMFEPYLSICERYNIPIALHTGMSFPNTPYLCCPKFRTYFGNPQLIEDALVKHPRLKVQVAHMGYPYLEETKAILNVYPQVYVDAAVVDWLIPKADFYNYLKALIDGGFEKRIMYGSDEMVWSDAISLSIKILKTHHSYQKNKSRIFFTTTQQRFSIYIN